MSVERKWWVAGITSVPLYLVTAILASKLSPLLWLLAVVGALFVIGMLYQAFVVRLVDHGSKPPFVLAWWVAVQIIGIVIIFGLFRAF